MQRKAVHEGETSFSVPPIVHDVLRSAGEPLDPIARKQFEPSLGHNFSHVRVHTDARAAESASAVNALAYTVGQEIVFASGQYEPQTDEGRRLIAHELAHTVQQQRASSLSRHSGAFADNEAEVHLWSDSNTEAEAERAADAAVTGESITLHQTPSLTLARQPLPQPQPRPVPGPSPTIDEEVKPKEDFSKVGMSQEWGREKTNWGWGSPETNNIYQECRVEPMKRDRFVSFAQSVSLPSDEKGCKPLNAIEVLGLTTFDPKKAVPPKIEAVPVQDGKKTAYKLKPAHAEMPPIQSAYTDKGSYVEGTRKYVEEECKGERMRRQSGDFPVNWTITDAGAKAIKQAEEEHCKDIEVAFNLSLGQFASSINNVAAAERTYSTEQDAIKDGTQAAGVKPAEMILKFYEMAIKTRLRDGNDWHTANASPNAARLFRQKPTMANGCKHAETIDAGSFENVGTVSSYDLMEMKIPPATAKKKGGRCPK